MAKFPPDRFDGVPDSLLRVGAHRSGRRRHSGLIMFAWAALACGVLVLIGVGVLALINGSVQFTDNSSSGSTSSTSSSSATKTPTATPTPTTAPITDPSKIDSTKTTITILNATATAGLAASAGDTLKSGGWVVGNEGNASSEVSTSIVYYDNSATDNKAIALGIAQKLGIATVEPSTAFPGATITVVLGADFSTK
jgi:cytoskeletal protein RodZ